MRLEEELMTSSFNDAAHKAHLNIFFTAAWLKNKMSSFFKPFTITMEQYNVLRIVRGATEPIMVKDISARMIERNSNTTRIIDRLEKKQYLERIQSKHDRRVFFVAMTATGAELMERIDAAIEANDPHHSNLDMKKYQQLNDILDEMRNLDSPDSE